MGETVTLGGDMTIRRLGFGAMRLAGPGSWGDYPDRDAAIRLLRRAVEAGVDLIDTADSYGPHTNEELIRDALAPYREQLVIATKGGFLRGGPDFADLGSLGSRIYLRQCAFLSARRLGVERIDLYYLHSARAEDAPFLDQVATLAELKQEGVIRHIGLANVTVEQFEAARQVTDIAILSGSYNIAERKNAPLIHAAAAAGVPFSSFRPTMVSRPDTPSFDGALAQFRPVLDPIRERYDATLAQIAIAWLLNSSPFLVPIPGTTSLQHLGENLAARAIELSSEDLEAISGLAAGPLPPRAVNPHS
jgi:pyridoxine 4-dehydrogenase